MHAKDSTTGCCGGAEALHIHHAGGACCGMTRRFPSKAERREALEAYREQLKNELTGVEERLEDLS